MAECFGHFQLRLVDLMDGLLEIFKSEPGYVFHIDAQSDSNLCSAEATVR